VALAWLWENFKLLILRDFLALAVALAIVDSKGLFGFGGAARPSKLFVFNSLVKIAGFGENLPNLGFFCLL
jgi:hypothetical protein